MKVRWVPIIIVGVIAIIAVAGLTLANRLYPPALDAFTSDKNVSQFQKLDLIIRGVTGVIALCALAVALFKEDIRRLWDKPKLVVGLVHADGFKEHLAQNLQQGAPETAERYSTLLQVANEGTSPVQNCVIKVVGLFDKDGSPHNVKIPPNGLLIPWDDLAQGAKMTLGLNHRSFAEVLKVTQPKNNNTNQSSNTPVTAASTAPTPPITQAELLFGTIECTKHYVLAHIEVSGENVEGVECYLEVTWDGTWKHRKTEMLKCLKVSRVSKYTKQEGV